MMDIVCTWILRGLMVGVSIGLTAGVIAGTLAGFGYGVYRAVVAP